MKYVLKKLSDGEFHNFNSGGGNVFEFEDGVQIGIANGESLEDGCCLCGVSWSCGECIQSNITKEKNIYECNSCICADCITKIVTLYKDGHFKWVNQ